GDDGTEVRYLELVGNGMNGLNRAPEGTPFLDRAIRIAKHDGYVGTPFMALEGKAEALAAPGHKMQADALMERTLAEVWRQATGGVRSAPGYCPLSETVEAPHHQAERVLV
ncbi:MAG: hypothetical protein ACRD11_14035, partial [Terriglobia bacterium]